jgi:phosphate-selective porin OprO/OprP
MRPSHPAATTIVTRLLFIALCCLPASTLAAADWPPRWRFADGWEVVPSASVQYQALHVSDDGTEDSNATGFRRQRAALTLESPSGRALKIDYDFSAGTWADVAFKLPLGEQQQLRFGQVKTPIGLDNVASHRDLAAFERAAVSTLMPGRRLAAEWSWSGTPTHLTVTAIGDNLDDQASGHGVFARATRGFGDAPDTGLLHLGIAGGVEWPDSPLRLRGRPDISGLPLTVVDSGTLDDIERIDRVAVEAAWDRGAWTVQAEYAWLDGHRDAEARSNDPAPSRSSTAEGAYIMAAWRPTGESRGYRDGVFKSPRPARAQGGVELVARLSRLSVETASGERRSGHSASVGGNWYLGDHWRLQAQVSSSPDDGAGRIVGLRLHHLF